MGKNDAFHPKGRQYSESELMGHRDKWYKYIAAGEWKSHVNFPVSDEDIFLFEDICSSFNDSIQSWMRAGDMRGTYPEDIFNPLVGLLDRADLPTFEFLNPGLEALKHDLLNAVDSFWKFLAANTFRVKNSIGLKAPRIWLLEHYYMETHGDSYDDYREKHYTQYYREGEILNDLVRSLWKRYCNFIRLGRRIIFEGKNL